MSDFNSTSHPTARKPHRCEECGRTIELGETYERVAAVWEGDFFTNRACQQCAAARRIVNARDRYYYETYYGGLREWIDNCMDGEVWALRLAACIRSHWRYQSGALMPVPEKSAA